MSDYLKGAGVGAIVFLCLLNWASFVEDITRPQEKLAPTPTRDLSGTYRATGVFLGGVKYSATVDIWRPEQWPTDRGVYAFTWTSRGSSYNGVGLLEGDRLCVAMNLGTDKTSLAIYAVEGKILKGRVVELPGKGEAYQEELVFIGE